MATYSLSLSSDQQEWLKTLLAGEGFSFRPLQHAFWQAVRSGITVSFYTSGRVVIQGSEDHIRWFQSLLAPLYETAISQIGCDECGKGDVFGPLVMAAVGVPRENYATLQMIGISESKKASPAQVEAWYHRILDLCQVETLVWEPAAYNELYRHYGNLNTILTLGYEDLLRRFEGSWDEVIVDAYTQDATTRNLLMAAAPARLRLETRAEKYATVGAASIVARKLFTDWFLSQPRPFPKGSGEEAKNLFLELKRTDPHSLHLYAKTHFFSSSPEERLDPR